MNKSMKKILLISLVIGFCILVTIDLSNPNWGIITSVSTLPPPSQLEIDLGKAIDRYKKGEVSEIDISSLTTFTWDRLYVFGAYTNHTELDSKFGKTWRDKCPVYIVYTDHTAFLVFVQNDRVIDCVGYPTYENDFSGLQKYELGFLPGEARFALNERGKVIWVGDK